jgi:hypothetical protein
LPTAKSALPSPGSAVDKIAVAQREGVDKISANLDLTYETLGKGALVARTRKLFGATPDETACVIGRWHGFIVGSGPSLGRRTHHSRCRRKLLWRCRAADLARKGFEQSLEKFLRYPV